MHSPHIQPIFLNWTIYVLLILLTHTAFSSSEVINLSHFENQYVNTCPKSEASASCQISKAFLNSVKTYYVSRLPACAEEYERHCKTEFSFSEAKKCFHENKQKISPQCKNELRSNLYFKQSILEEDDPK